MTGTATTSVHPNSLTRRAGEAWARDELPASTVEDWAAQVLADSRAGGRVVGLWGWPCSDVAVELLGVVAFDRLGRLGMHRCTVPKGGAYPSLTPALPALQAFERQLYESVGVEPLGHPWLKPLVRHADLEEAASEANGYPFFRVDGAGVHEVAVGPVHAGIIEPGHFRFQCRGETVLHLEIQLGYQHRGAESLLLRSAPARRLVIAESIAGDTVIGHATAYCQAVEALAGAPVPPRAQALRAVALELERIANHVGDLGALCGDVGYLPGASYLGRLRGDFLNLLLELTGNRFGRGLLIPGGVRFDLDDRLHAHFARCLAAAERDVDDVAAMVFAEPSVSSRFEQTGPLSFDAADALGIVGPAARASGCCRDVRADHPTGFYRFAHIPVTEGQDGDVFARALIRHLEARRSIAFVREEVEQLPEGPIGSSVGPLAANAAVLTLVEGWRGEIAHLAVTDAGGDFETYQVSDPSLHNWLGLAFAMRGQQISDFPLCNKSFNLSYAGHDR